MKEGKSVLLSRHSETEWNRLGKWTGRTNIPLNNRGRQQSERWAFGIERIVYENELDIKCIHSSSSIRAVETAGSAEKRLGISIITAASLKEVDHGLCEGMTYEEVKRRYPDIWRQYRTDKSKLQFPGGESIEMAFWRVQKGIVNITEVQEKDNDVLIVAHGGSIILGLIALLGEPLEKYSNYGRLQNASIVVLQFLNGRYVLKRYMWMPHLEISERFLI